MSPLPLCFRFGQLTAFWLISVLFVCGQGFVGDVGDANESPLERAKRARQELMLRMQEEQRQSNSAEETLENRIVRLKRELAQAEADLVSRNEAEALAARSEIERVSAALVVIVSEASEGAGFIAEMRGRTFLVTNIHVLGAARGALIQTGAGVPIDLPSYAFVSRRRDVAIVPIEWDGPTLPISQSLSFDEVEVGQAVTILEHFERPSLPGDIRYLGRSELEVVGQFDSGTSGAPIMHDELGKVIAIATRYQKTPVSEDYQFGRDMEFGEMRFGRARAVETRCVGYRLDGEIEWVQVDLLDLYSQGEAYARYEDRTRAMSEIGSALKRQNSLVTEYSQHESLGYLYGYFDRDFKWHAGGNSSHDQRLMKRFVTSVMSELLTDQQSTQEALQIQYYQRHFLALEDLRNQATKDFWHFRKSRLD